MLPFALRWITKEWEEKEARELLENISKEKKQCNLIQY
jgi:methionine aminopeptidase, type II (EC 3.4.11.18)